MNYSDNELKEIYALGYSLLINANYKLAENIFRGLIKVSTNYDNAYLGLSTSLYLQKNYEESLQIARDFYDKNKFSVTNLLIMISNLLKLKDYQNAGTLLGEVSDLVKENNIFETNIIKYNKLLNLQYEFRS